MVSLRDPERTDERTVDVDGVSLLLDGFQDDPRWSRFVAGQVTKGIPALEKLVGAKWPGGLERIREDASPSLRGYDGWFDPTDDEIVIGEQLDADLIFHELSHAWVSERALRRALGVRGAGPGARRAGRQGHRRHAVRAPEGVARVVEQAVALNAWGGSAGTRSEDVDAYAYPAAYAATRRSSAASTTPQLAAVLGAAHPRRARLRPGRHQGRQRRAHHLDALARPARDPGRRQRRRRRSSGAGCSPASSAPPLAPRAKARAAYATVDEADGAWLPPEGLRDAMTDWDFERAARCARRWPASVPPPPPCRTAAKRAGVEVPDAVRASYESAEQDEQYTALATALPKAAAAVTAVGAARAGRRARTATR